MKKLVLVLLFLSALCPLALSEDLDVEALKAKLEEQEKRLADLKARMYPAPDPNSPWRFRCGFVGGRSLAEKAIPGDTGQTPILPCGESGEQQEKRQDGLEKNAP